MVVASCAKITDGQFKGARVFDPVPVHLRARLDERLKLYAKYERSMNYEKLYELISEHTINNLNGITKDAYIEYRLKKAAHPANGILLNFIPIATEYRESLGAYRVRGHARLRYQGGILKQEVIIYAWLHNCDWYFSEVLIEITD